MITWLLDRATGLMAMFLAIGCYRNLRHPNGGADPQTLAFMLASLYAAWRLFNTPYEADTDS